MDIRIENEIVSNFLSIKAKLKSVDNLMFMASPIPVVFIWLSYLIFVLKLGPTYMKNRPAFTLNGLLVIYNIIQVVSSVYMAYLGIQVLYPVKYIYLSCANDDETMQKVTSAMHTYFLAKIFELLDTVFIVLRKKQSQVSFLHVYHHAIMILVPWVMLKFEPSESTILSILVNSLIHVVMYTYYGLSAFPSLTKYLWWKKYLTRMQLIQFLGLTVHIIGHFMFGECQPGPITFYLILYLGVTFTILFSNFYIKSYRKLKRVEEIKKMTSKEEMKKVE